MLFSSVPFLFYFLPAALLIYFAAPRQLKNAVLLLASLFFYAWGEPKYMLLMLVSIVQGYGFGLLIEKHRGQKASKVFLTLSILVSLGLLGYFKYADFFLSSVNAVTGLSLPLLKLSLPIGISFYTFQVLSYVIDVYRGETAAQRNFIDLAAYVSLFPQLIAGPIVRYSDVAAELKSRTHSVSAAAEGVRRFTVGFAKKILLANQFGALASAYKSTQDASVLFVWLYALAFLLQVYFDFSGYSDMAIGLGRMLGFHFPENFNYPYISASITEFWRRWHMSLGSWFRDYLYIPLGGSRKGKARQLLNILIVWLASAFFTGLIPGTLLISMVVLFAIGETRLDPFTGMLFLMEVMTISFWMKIALAMMTFGIYLFTQFDGSKGRRAVQTIFTAVFWLMLAFIPFIISTHLPSTGSWRAYGDPSYLSIFPYLSDLWLTGFSIWGADKLTNWIFKE